MLKIFSVGIFGMCYTAYCKKGVIKAFYHPLKIAQKSCKKHYTYIAFCTKMTKKSPIYLVYITQKNTKMRQI